MKTLALLLISVVTFFVASTDVLAGWVNGYYRSNGTYVQGYWRNDGGYSTPSYTTYTTTYSTPVSCSTTYGIWATDNYDGTCSCMSGYSFGINILGKKECLSIDQQCKDQYGYGAKASGSSCTCKDGYAFETGFSGKKCQMQFCGLYSTFNDSTKSCECNTGYTQDTSYSTFTCKKKAISAYFLLLSLDEVNSTAIIYTNWKGGSYYSVDYGYGCYRISNYLNKLLVVNLMYDQKLSYGDYLILHNDDQNCKITSYTDITNSIDLNNYSTENYSSSSSATTTVPTCGKNSYASETGKCSCKTGYTWEFPDISNNYDCKIKPTVCSDTTNGYLGTDNKCYCNAGYTWNATSNSCKKTSTVLKCKKGELKRNGKCVSMNQLK